MTKAALRTPSPLDLEARAQPLWLQAAKDAGRAAAYRLRGEDARAEIFEQRVRAAETLAAELEAEAFALRLRAAAEARCSDLADVLAQVAA